MTLFHLAVFLINGPLYIPPHKKQQMKKHDVPVPVDNSRRLTCKHCPFVHIGARLILLCIAFILSRLIDFETLEQCVRKLLNGKATGVDGIPREFYKYGPQGLLELHLMRTCEAKHRLFVPKNG